MEIREIKSMSSANKLKVMENLWDSLLDDANRLPSPSWHKTVLEERLAKIEDGTATYISLEDLKKKKGL